MRPQLGYFFRGITVASGLLIAIVVCGCKGGTKDPNALGAKYNPVFASAPAEVKTPWETANSALKTNGYAVAIFELQAVLQQPNLSPEQSAAAKETVNAVSAQMYAQANKGDAAARQAIDDLRKARNR
jgi:hypothetical protein